jgi:hypothetical protein
MAESTRKSVKLLPNYFQTDKNQKFLSSTIDQLINVPQLERIDGFIGSKLTPNYNPLKDQYISEKSITRKNYQLEPAIVFRNDSAEIKDVVGFDDLINESLNEYDKIDVDKIHESFSIVLNHIKKPKKKMVIENAGEVPVNDEIIEIAVDKFNEKYYNLNEGQKNLLRQYINSVSE